MSRHFILMDPLEKLVIKKDSTAMLALTMKQMGKEVYLLFESGLSFDNQRLPLVECYDFDGGLSSCSLEVEKLTVRAAESLLLASGDILHMRLDPPFDSRYLRFLWILSALEKQGVRVINRPEGILTVHEKLSAYLSKDSLPSYVGTSLVGLRNFKEHQVVAEYILKPLDFYQGIGVEKVSGHQLEEAFLQKVQDLKGPVIVQPFWRDIAQGEVRSIFYRCHELGNILKKPAQGNYMANVAQGASFEPYQLAPVQQKVCREVAKELYLKGIDWVAFDLFGDSLSEVNITCPGLLVEVSKALKTNLAQQIVELMDHK